MANSAVDGEPAGPLLALAVLAGSLSHVLADGLTVAGSAGGWPADLEGFPGGGSGQYRSSSGLTSSG